MSKWLESEIVDAIQQTEVDRAEYVSAVETWRNMWKLCFWSDKDQKAAQKEGRELSTLMWPRNTVNLANRLIGVDPKISCPAYDEYDMDNSKARAEFLRTLWQAQSYGQKMHPLHAMRWHMNVSARCAVRLIWTGTVADETSKGTLPPIMIQPLDPINIGCKDGLYYPQYIYHRYRDDVRSILQRYPQAKAKLVERFGEAITKPGKTRLYATVTDFWYCDDAGKKHKINNAIMVDQHLVKEFLDLPYPRIPLFVKVNDPAPLNDALWEGGSILSGQYDTWRQMNQLASMHLTATKENFWPETNLISEEGEEVPEINRGRGEVNVFPRGVKPLGNLSSPVNVQLSASMLEMLAGQQREATFPAALYGDPGAMRSAFGYSMMSSAGMGRIADTIFQLQQICQDVNSLALCMVKKFGDGPMKLYGYDKANNEMYGAELSPDQIGERYDNTVTIGDNIPSEGLQGLVAALQMYDRKIISGETIREDYSTKPPRKDEIYRILEEQVWQDPDLMKARMRHLFEARYGVPLPEGEPDGELTQKPQGMQQAQTIPGANIPLEMQGQYSPEMMGDAGIDPMAFQTMGQGSLPSPEMALQMLQGRSNGR